MRIPRQNENSSNKNQFKMIKNLNVKSETMKALKHRKMLQGIGIDEDFFFFWKRSQMYRKKDQTDKYYLKLKTFLSNNRMKGHTEWEKMHANHTSEKEIIIRIHKELQKGR